MSAPAAPLTPEDLKNVRTMRIRSRVCRYLFNAAGIWLIVFASFWAWNEFGLHNREVAEHIFQLSYLGYTIIMVVAFAVTLAVYRCPACDKYLSRFRKDKLHCPACGTRIYEKKVGF